MLADMPTSLVDFFFLYCNFIYLFPFGQVWSLLLPCPTIVTSSFVVINLQGKQLISCYQFYTLSINNSVDVVVIRIQWSQRQ